MSKTINIGLFGFGSVGSGVYHSLQQIPQSPFSISKIVVKNPSKVRSIHEALFSFDANAIFEDESIDVIVELIDDAEAAYHIVKKGIELGKPVISANKKMLAKHLPELVALAKEKEIPFLYEAAVCGSIPILRTLDNFYALDYINSVRAIANGTCNYLLTRLDDETSSFQEILEQAQRHGFAESDPTLDIDAWDSAFKLQLLIFHAYGNWIETQQLIRFGIRNIRSVDVAYAKRLGKKWKLVIQSKQVENKIQAVVAPQLVHEDDFLHDVSFEFNGVEIEASFAEKQLYKGKGAGSIPTASAVLADLKAVTKAEAYAYPKQLDEAKLIDDEYKIQIYASSIHPEKFNNIPWLTTNKLEENEAGFVQTGSVLAKDLHAFQQGNKVDFFIGFI